ncbi:MAG: aldolase [Novosphingobium sp.]|nr:aldolase [Novosphingobium sp.]
MLDVLKKGRDDFGVIAVKAEFEAEGTRSDEFLRLLHLAHYANLRVALKIGGCEAVSDLLASKLYGVDYIIAPMVETPYALSKFVEAKAKTHGANEERTEFLFNLETQTTLDNLDGMVAQGKGNVDGIVFGRVDFTLSRGMPRDAINHPSITEAVLRVARVCALNNLELVVGGSVAPASIDALRQFRAVRLDRFETRKVVFDGAAVETASIEAGIQNAVDFELAWLENKQAYYSAIAREDAARIDMMKNRQESARLAVATA